MRKKPKKQQPKQNATTIRDYTKLRQSAYELIVNNGHSQKDAAEMLNVSEKTMSDWANEGKWREQRKGRQLCHSTDAENIKRIINLVAERRLRIELSITDAIASGDNDLELSLRTQARSLSDELAKQNKALATLDKENRITLGVYIDVLDDIFSALRQYDEQLWMSLLDFQSMHIRTKTMELG